MNDFQIKKSYIQYWYIDFHLVHVFMHVQINQKVDYIIIETYWKFLLNMKSINDAIFFKEIWNGTGGLLCIFINKTNFLQDLSIQHGKTSCEDQIIICCTHLFAFRGFSLARSYELLMHFSDSLRDCIYLTIQNMYYDENALTTNFISDTTNILHSF